MNNLFSTSNKHTEMNRIIVDEYLQRILMMNTLLVL